MTPEQFIKAIKQMPLPSSIKKELEDMGAVESMKADWAKSSNHEREIWLSSLSLMCLTEYAEEFGCIPAEYAEKALHVCASSIKNMQYHKRVGNGVGHHIITSYTVMYEIRKVGQGIGADSSDLPAVQNEFIKKLSAEATPADCFLYNVMLRISDPTILSQLTLRYFQSFTALRDGNDADDNNTVISAAVDTAFDKIFNAEIDSFNTVQQMQLAMLPDKIKKVIIIFIVLFVLLLLATA